MITADIDYHHARASREREIAARCPQDLVWFHTKLANLHEERARKLESGELDHDDEMLIAR